MSNNQIVTAAHCIKHIGKINFAPGSAITVNYIDQYQNNTTITHELKTTVKDINIFKSYLTNHCDTLPENSLTVELCTDNDSAVIILPSNAAILPGSVTNDPYEEGFFYTNGAIKAGSRLIIVGSGSGIIKYSTATATPTTIQSELEFGGAWIADDPLLTVEAGDSGGPLYIYAQAHTQSAR